MFKIDKNIPMPDRKRIGSTKAPTKKYPLAEMEIGDSFFVPVENNNRFEKHARVVTIHSSKNTRTLLKRKKFETRLVEGGVRCWRTE